MFDERRLDTVFDHDTTNFICLYVQWSAGAGVVGYIFNPTGQNIVNGHILSAAYIPWRGNT